MQWNRPHGYELTRAQKVIGDQLKVAKIRLRIEGLYHGRGAKTKSETPCQTLGTKHSRDGVKASRITRGRSEDQTDPKKYVKMVEGDETEWEGRGADTNSPGENRKGMQGEGKGERKLVSELGGREGRW
eukprot:767881-Hanusia_phi.AAC.4